ATSPLSLHAALPICHGGRLSYQALCVLSGKAAFAFSETDGILPLVSIESNRATVPQPCIASAPRIDCDLVKGVRLPVFGLLDSRTLAHSKGARVSKKQPKGVHP